MSRLGRNQVTRAFERNSSSCDGVSRAYKPTLLVCWIDINSRSCCVSGYNVGQRSVHAKATAHAVW